MAYTTKGAVQNYLAVDIDSSLDSQITTWISAIQAWIDRYVGFSFESSSATDRYYDSEGGREIMIDPYYGTPTVTILDSDGSVYSTIDADYVMAYPLNDSQKYSIVLRDGIDSFPHGNYRVKVNATFGYGVTAPEDVKLCATKLLASVVAKAIDGGKLTQNQIGDQTLSFATIDESAEALGIYNILDQYRPISI